MGSFLSSTNSVLLKLFVLPRVVLLCSEFSWKNAFHAFVVVLLWMNCVFCLGWKYCFSRICDDPWGFSGFRENLDQSLIAPLIAVRHGDSPGTVSNVKVLPLREGVKNSF